MKKLVLSLAIALTALVLRGSGVAQEAQEAQENQEARIAPNAIPCPLPVPKSLKFPSPGATLPVAATPYLPDFGNTKCSAGYEPKFGGTTSDRCLRHTFTWKPETACCQNMSGTLTITFKAIAGADNDQLVIYSNGAAVGPGRAIYSGPTTVGQTVTKSFPLTAAMLANNRCSFLVQDDTSVLSATLDVVTCCLRRAP